MCRKNAPNMFSADCFLVLPSSVILVLFSFYGNFWGISCGEDTQCVQSQVKKTDSDIHQNI